MVSSVGYPKNHRCETTELLGGPGGFVKPRGAVSKAGPGWTHVGHLRLIGRRGPGHRTCRAGCRFFWPQKPVVFEEKAEKLSKFHLGAQKHKEIKAKKLANSYYGLLELKKSPSIGGDHSFEVFMLPIFKNSFEVPILEPSACNIIPKTLRFDLTAKNLGQTLGSQSCATKKQLQGNRSNQTQPNKHQQTNQTQPKPTNKPYPTDPLPLAAAHPSGFLLLSHLGEETSSTLRSSSWRAREGKKTSRSRHPAGFCYFLSEFLWISWGFS